MNNSEQILEIFLKEYDKLKSEQTQRIGFRDNLLYVTLGTYGAIVSFALSKTENYNALILVPWISVVLGWMYLVNDQKISAIGKYLRETLAKNLKEKLSLDLDEYALLGWEIDHRSDNRRKRRKIEQFLIDEIAFVVPGMLAIYAFWRLSLTMPFEAYILIGIEVLLLLALAIEIFVYADFGGSKPKPEQNHSTETP
jgi:hypothetical protein